MEVGSFHILQWGESRGDCLVLLVVVILGFSPGVVAPTGGHFALRAHMLTCIVCLASQVKVHLVSAWLLSVSRPPQPPHSTQLSLFILKSFPDGPWRKTCLPRGSLGMLSLCYIGSCRKAPRGPCSGGWQCCLQPAIPG